MGPSPTPGAHAPEATPSPEEVTTGFCCAEDELLDELDATIHQLGRLFSSRHGEGSQPACPADLSGPKSLALYVIASHRTLRQSDIAMHLGVKAPAVSSLVDGLVEAGLVEREADPDDRRATRVALTELGRVTLAEIEQQRRELMRNYCSVLTHDDIRNLIRIHRKLIESMTAGRI